MARSTAAVLLAALAGCVRLPSPDLTVGSARFRIVYAPADAAAARQVRRALEVAAPRVERWGGLRQPVTITVHPTHAALEAAADRRGYAWLHAWARFGTVDLQSPRTWDEEDGGDGQDRGSELEEPGSDRAVEELLTHELTHCAMYQGAGTELSWMLKEIPRWFSEGLATVTAGQGHRFARLADLSAFYRDAPARPGEEGARPGLTAAALPGDPIADPDISPGGWRLAYGAAHHAVAFLIARYGEDTVIQILRRMSAGLRFPAAFREAVGIDEAEFTADFRRYVVREGWRRE